MNTSSNTLLRKEQLVLIVGRPSGLADCVRGFNTEGDVDPVQVEREVEGLLEVLGHHASLQFVDLKGDGFFKQDPATPIYAANGTGRPMVVVNRMGTPERESEPRAHLPAFREIFDAEQVLEMPEGAMGEGGDVIIVPDPKNGRFIYFVGKPEHAPGRTNQAGRDFLRECVERNGNVFREVAFDADLALHLSTCCGYPGFNAWGEQHVITGYGQVLDTAPFEEFGIEVLDTELGDQWGSNVLRLPSDDAPLIVQDGYPSVTRLLEEHAYESVMRHIPWGEVRKLDGSLTCGVCVLQVSK